MISPTLDTYIRCNGDGYDISGVFFEIKEGNLDPSYKPYTINQLTFYPSTGCIAAYKFDDKEDA